MKKYNIINNSLGWLCFVVAAVTYLLTIEPTASFWDCPEFISQGMKLEVGHPPGNPIFILTARFFINFAGGDPSNVPVAVNVMSALLSAATILLLFWTITHFARRLMLDRNAVPSPMQTAIIMGCGLVGALMYTWSDTFWFSAVEGEVYAFSSFCTALVLWLVLKWENRADHPHSDRYLILIAYIIGISIAVHLLNLLTIPALALVIYFRKVKNVTGKQLLLTILGSFVVVALILYGLVPGFVENAQYFELFFTNTLGMGFNTGVLIYTVLLVGVLIWCINALYRQKSIWEIRISFFLSIVLSGIPFIGSSAVIPVVISLALGAYLLFAKKLYVRYLTIIAVSILVIFVGYSSYALILIRANANPPMNQNSPDNVFALGSYLNREQYGQTPLLRGQAFTSTVKGIVDPETTTVETMMTPAYKYEKKVKASPDEPDQYILIEDKMNTEYEYTPTMFFPRMHSNADRHPQAYLDWIGETEESLDVVETTPYYMPDGKPFSQYGQPYTEQIPMPSFGQNLRFFFTYQLNYMYWRYFMWNFAGRQNDIQGQGEVNFGNWISGIPVIDNARLGDQSLLPDEYGKGNKGHNVFYMLPLLFGLLGIAAQLYCGARGVKQFWIVFLFFFMTGIAIVLYLNQPPLQPRERDYAFAGSFYAFAIWVGMGVYMLWLLVERMLQKKKAGNRGMLIAAVATVAVCLAMPIQVVSQTWDDHDRSGRYTARDYGMNYLSSLDDNAIIFTNGDNDTFPLWYAQEVEGYRRDVRVINLAYLTTDWYANHAKMPAYGDNAIEFQAQPDDYAYDRLRYNILLRDSLSSVPVDVFSSLNDLYTSPTASDPRGFRVMRYPNMYIPVSVDDAVERGVISADQAPLADDYISVNLGATGQGGVTLSEALSIDMIAHGAANGWKRPAYFAMTVPDEYYRWIKPNLRNTGLAYQVTPIADPEGMQAEKVATDKMYDNVMNRFRWGGLDVPDADIYLDETVRRMVNTHRKSLMDLANELYNEGITALYYEGDSIRQIDGEIVADESRRTYAEERFHKAVDVLNLMEEKLPVRLAPYSIEYGKRAAELYESLGHELKDRTLKDKAFAELEAEIMRYAQHIPYYASLLTDEQRRRDSSSDFLYSSQPATIASLNLSYIDMYIPQHLSSLMNTYTSFGGNLEELFDKIDDKIPSFQSSFAVLLNSYKNK